MPQESWFLGPIDLFQSQGHLHTMDTLCATTPGLIVIEFHLHNSRLSGADHHTCWERWLSCVYLCAVYRVERSLKYSKCLGWVLVQWHTRALWECCTMRLDPGSKFLKVLDSFWVMYPLASASIFRNYDKRFPHTNGGLQGLHLQLVLVMSTKIVTSLTQPCLTWGASARPQAKAVAFHSFHKKDNNYKSGLPCWLAIGCLRGIPTHSMLTLLITIRIDVLWPVFIFVRFGKDCRVQTWLLKIVIEEPTKYSGDTPGAQSGHETDDEDWKQG
jgi:hypothetical protein